MVRSGRATVQGLLLVLFGSRHSQVIVMPFTWTKFRRHSGTNTQMLVRRNLFSHHIRARRTPGTTVHMHGASHRLRSSVCLPKAQHTQLCTQESIQLSFRGSKARVVHTRRVRLVRAAQVAEPALWRFACPNTQRLPCEPLYNKADLLVSSVTSQTGLLQCTVVFRVTKVRRA